MKKLTPKQQTFVDEYIISGNATQSYLKAGYKVSENVAAANANRLLRNAKIKAELERRTNEIRAGKVMTMQEVMERLTKMANGEIKEEQVTNKGEVVLIGTKNSDQIRAMELIGKRYGAWTDKKEVTGGLEINVGVGDWDADD
ncbi:terminase small subunit [Ligilactobacillus agilis]|uniref:terminase small subunit n=1 Tax=Ligilactobacillus agilis TaxID=1601 RepID=UPI003F8AFBEF